MRSAAKRNELHEWRMRQRGELINDPREAERAQRDIEQRMGGGERGFVWGGAWRGGGLTSCSELRSRLFTSPFL